MRVVVRIQGSDRLDFRQHGILHENSGGVITGGAPLVFNSDCELSPASAFGAWQFLLFHATYATVASERTAPCKA